MKLRKSPLIAVLGVGLAISAAACNTADQKSAASQVVSAASAQAPATTPTAPAPTAPPTTAAPQATAEEAQALDAAKSYLTLGTGFSESGLVQQLTSSAGNGFPLADAQWAVAHSGADWDQQALLAAKGYLQLGGFSRSSMIQQLTSSAGNGFTLSEATYAVNQVGLS